MTGFNGVDPAEGQHANNIGNIDPASSMSSVITGSKRSTVEPSPPSMEFLQPAKRSVHLTLTHGETGVARAGQCLHDQIRSRVGTG